MAGEGGQSSVVLRSSSSSEYTEGLALTEAIDVGSLVNYKDSNTGALKCNSAQLGVQ